MPLAGGPVATTLAIGTAFFPDSVAWWLPAALLSASPIIAIAGQHRAEPVATRVAVPGYTTRTLDQAITIELAAGMAL